MNNDIYSKYPIRLSLTRPMNVKPWSYNKIYFIRSLQIIILILLNVSYRGSLYNIKRVSRNKRLSHTIKHNTIDFSDEKMNELSSTIKLPALREVRKGIKYIPYYLDTMIFLLLRKEVLINLEKKLKWLIILKNYTLIILW